jgi:hypothetical protein
VGVEDVEEGLECERRTDMPSRQDCHIDPKGWSPGERCSQSPIDIKVVDERSTTSRARWPDRVKLPGIDTDIYGSLRPEERHPYNCASRRERPLRAYIDDQVRLTLTCLQR